MPLEFQPRARLADPSWFFGRDQDLRRLFAYIAKDYPQNVSLVGQRRVGKSWILQAIELDANLRARYINEPKKFTFVYWDLQCERHLNPGYFLQKILEIILSKLPVDLRQVFAEEIKGEETEDALATVLSLLEVADHHIILLIDEFDKIMGNTAFAEDFFSHLRFLFGKSWMTSIIASYHTLKDICGTLGSDSPFFGIFSRVQIGLFSDDEARNYVIAAFANCGVNIEEAAVREIIHLAGANPCFISVLCHDLFHCAPVGVITAADVQTLSGNFQTNVSSDYQYFLEHLNDEERAMLLNINEGNLPASPVNPVYNRLKELSLVVERGGRPEPFSTSFHQYIRESKGTDVYFQKAFSNTELNSPSFIRLCDVVLKTSTHLPPAISGHLQAAIQAIRARPHEAMRICGRDVLPQLIDRVYTVETGTRWNSDQYMACEEFMNRAKAKAFSMHLVAHFHSVRISGNDGAHDANYIEACTPARAFLTVLETIHLADEVFKRYP
jgi:hypothetical protein